MESKKKNNPLFLKHIRILRATLITIGAWPIEAIGETFIFQMYSRYFIVVTCLIGFGEMNYIAKNINVLSFFDLGDISMTMFLTILTLIRSLLPAMKGYRLVTIEFLKFHLIHYRHKGEYYKKMFNNVNKLSHYFTWFMVACMVFSTLFFNIVPFYNNCINGAFTKNKTHNYKIQFSIYSQFPGFNAEEHLTNVTIVNLYLSYICALFVCAIDLLMYLMAFQIIGHIKVLIHDLKNITKPKGNVVMNMVCQKTKQNINLCYEIYDDDENNTIREEIVKFIEHHRSIVSFAGSVSQFYGPMLAFNYMYHLVACGLLLLECSRGEPETYARYIPITIITFGQLIQISITFEIVGSESQKLKDEVYDMPWECMNVSNQKLVWMFLCKIQIPIRVTALGMVEIGVQAMLAILKTSFSYFALLQSLNE